MHSEENQVGLVLPVGSDEDDALLWIEVAESRVDQVMTLSNAVCDGGADSAGSRSVCYVLGAGEVGDESRVLVHADAVVLAQPPGFYVGGVRVRGALTEGDLNLVHETQVEDVVRVRTDRNREVVSDEVVAVEWQHSVVLVRVNISWGNVLHGGEVAQRVHDFE